MASSSIWDVTESIQPEERRGEAVLGPAQAPGAFRPAECGGSALGNKAAADGSE